jgi:lipoprotein-anchoring transpeptidase ErfK/SrfK
MALPSQSDRTSELGRAYVYREKGAGYTPRSGNHQKTIVAIVGSLIIIGTAWGIVRILPSGTPKESTQASAPTPITAGFSAAPEPAPTFTFQTGKPEPTRQATPAPDPTTQPATEPAKTPEGTRPKLDDPSKLIVEDPSKSPKPVEAVPQSPAPAAEAAPQTQLPPSASTADVVSLIAQAESRITSDPVQARVLYSKAYRAAAPSDQASIRAKLEELNKTLVFSAKVTPGDPLAEVYAVASGDSLVKIAKKRDLGVDWRFIQRINNADPRTLRVGQKLKLVRGPFHAVVHKSDYRIDVFQGAPDDPNSWIYIHSCKVGLGEGNSTPVGTFVIRKGSKLVNPHWVNPRTGQKFDKDDPANPIGEHWLGLEGVGDSAALTGYGLHGTIDPASIGQQRSMGCVRMADADIALVYEMLEEQISVVKIVP